MCILYICAVYSQRQVDESRQFRVVSTAAIKTGFAKSQLVTGLHTIYLEKVGSCVGNHHGSDGETTVRLKYDRDLFLGCQVGTKKAAIITDAAASSF